MVDQLFKKKNTVAERESLRYHLTKFEVLIKRKAGRYVLMDAQNKRIITSGEQRKKPSENGLLKQKTDPQETIAFLKSLNNYLEKTENLNAKRSVLTLFE